MNPILEEDDSDSDSASGDPVERISAQPRLSFTYFEDSPSPADSSDDTFSTSPETFTGKADSLAKWRDFKPTAGRLSEGASNQEAFPVLVRRLEVEAGPMIRKNSLTKENSQQKRDFDDSPVKGRSEASSFSISATDFIKFDKQKSIDSAEDEDNRQEDGLAVARPRPEPNIVDRVLDIQRSSQMTPEDLLAMAIHEKEVPSTSRRGSIWTSFGAKRRAEEVCREVGCRQGLAEWERTKERVSELDQQKAGIITAMETAKRQKIEQTSTNADLTDLINTTSATIKDTRKARKAAKDAYSRETEIQQAYHERLIEDKAIAVKDTTEHLTAALEEEERWKARIEELSQTLLTVEEDRLEALQDREEYQSLLQDLRQSHQEFEEQQRQTELCLELLADAMDYFSQSQEHIQFNVSRT